MGQIIKAFATGLLALVGLGACTVIEGRQGAGDHFDLAAEVLTHLCVDDHPCYAHYRQAGSMPMAPG